MKLFDLHCDTIERMEELGENMLTDKTQRFRIKHQSVHIK